MASGLLLPAFVVLAAKDSSAQDLLHTYDLARGREGTDDLFGASLCVLGDIDGDGAPEVVIGAMDLNVKDRRPTYDGAIFVYSTATGALIRRHDGSGLNTRLGFTVAGGKDLDGDGTPDYLAGGPGDDSGPFDGGSVYAWSGLTGALLYRLDGHRSFDAFGSGLAVVDDADGDGCADFLVTSPSWDDLKAGYGGAGRCDCVSGRTGAFIWSLTGAKDAQSIAYCCRVDDLTGDGVAEVAVGSSAGGSGKAGEGQLDVVDGVTGSILHTLYGENPGDRYGICGSLGDVDGDGLRDFVVVAPFLDGPQIDGRAYVYSSATMTELYRIDGLKGDYGGAPSGPGRFDANDDGFDDFTLGYSLRPVHGVDFGVVSLFSGRTGRLLYDFRANSDLGIEASISVAHEAIADLDGDGAKDLIMGAHNVPSGPGWNSAGRAYLINCRKRFLQADRREYATNDPITLDLRGGTPGVLGLIAVIAIDGTPLFETVAFGALDANGELAYSDVADASLSGLTIDVIGLTQKPNGRGSLTTGVETLFFQ